MRQWIRKLSLRLRKNNEALNDNFKAIQKSLQKLGDRQDEADKDRKLLQQHQMRQDKIMMSMFQGMKKSFPDNFVDVVDADEEPDCMSDDGSVRIIPGHEETAGNTKKKAAKPSGGKATVANPRVFREPYPLRGRATSDTTNGASSSSAPSSAGQEKGPTPSPGAPSTQPSVSLDPKECSMTAVHTLGACAWAIEGSGETARVGVVKIQEFTVQEGTAGAICQPFDIVANAPTAGATAGFLTSDRLFTDKEEAAAGLELFRSAKKTKSH